VKQSASNTAIGQRRREELYIVGGKTAFVKSIGQLNRGDQKVE